MAKLNLWAFQRRFPEAPWLVESAIYLLDKWLRPSDRGIEWGAGRSTIWFASRVQHLITVESNQQWYEKVKVSLREKGLLEKVDLHYIPVDVKDSENPVSHPFADIVDSLPDESIDFALVDAKIRVLCMEKVMEKIKPRGLLILDNSERYVPNKVMGQSATLICTCDRCPDDRWAKLMEKLHPWREIMTTNGIWDTRLWVKPTGNDLFDNYKREPKDR